ncbi:MAG: NADH-quinone oxidoreductase subunit L [Lachnospiraceae bacterium]|nr:NADH-quinone oxidoreductase subunit L [Lachnospiraceae bacterium]
MASFTVPFLIIFPFVSAVLSYCTRINKLRNGMSYISSVIIMAVTGLLFVQWCSQGAAVTEIYYETHTADRVILILEIILAIYITVLSFRHRKYWISLLSIGPTGLIVWFELFGPGLKETARIRIDHLSMLMCLIIGIIGSLIIVYAVGYMHGYHHHHRHLRDRRYYFFTLLFVFLGAMYGFVLSDNLLWIDFFWELTSVCSFLLIGYTHEPVAISNSFRALWMNLLGGTALAIGIVYMGFYSGTVSLHELIGLGTGGVAAATIPIALIAFAALTKAAQMPFSTWLIGAMVAPTPSSALLHSATMVKAGIYILFRLSPAMAKTTTGNMIAFIGGFTFLITSFMAIAQSDGKKVLAFSTISNLGLMVACAGMGRSETIWAGIFLMLFHAISKSLLFQDVGATENCLHSRDIEDMHGLLYILPRLAFFMFIGIAGMFLAPFGMLISKWSALKASVNEGNIIMVFFICLGSATTSFYWTKWMGKIISASHLKETQFRDITKKNELISLWIHAVLMITLCLLFPLLSHVYVNPLIEEMFGFYSDVLPTQILLTLVVIIGLVFAVPLLAFLYSRKMRKTYVLSYMNGVNAGNNMKFIDSFGEQKTLWMSNFYFHKWIGQRKLMGPSQFFAAAVLVVMMSMIIGGVRI